MKTSKLLQSKIDMVSGLGVENPPRGVIENRLGMQRGKYVDITLFRMDSRIRM